jgi:cell division protein FtsA
LLYGLQKQANGISMSALSSYNDEPKQPVLERLKRWIQGNF